MTVIATPTSRIIKRAGAALAALGLTAIDKVTFYALQANVRIALPAQGVPARAQLGSAVTSRPMLTTAASSRQVVTRSRSGAIIWAELLGVAQASVSRVGGRAQPAVNTFVTNVAEASSGAAIAVAILFGDAIVLRARPGIVGSVAGLG